MVSDTWYQARVMANSTISASAVAATRVPAAGANSPGAPAAFAATAVVAESRADSGVPGAGTMRRPLLRRRFHPALAGVAPRPGMSHSNATATRASGTVTRVPRKPSQPITAAINRGLRAAPALPPTEKIDIEAPRRRLCATDATTEPAGWNSAEPRPPSATTTSSGQKRGTSPTAP